MYLGGLMVDFSPFFYKVNSFFVLMFASLHIEAFWKPVSSKRKDFVPMGTTFQKGGKQFLKVSPESVPILLNPFMPSVQ